MPLNRTPLVARLRDRFVRQLGIGMMLLACFCDRARAEEAGEPVPIAIAEIQHEGSVDFEREVLPIFKKNCIACHNHATKRGELVLETPQTIAAGGASGNVVDPDNPDESYLLMVASHQSDPVMPPAENKVGAAPLTPQQLGLLRRWIQEGAKGEVKDRAAAIQWQPLPAGINPIYASAVTPDGQFAACGRANQIYVYHLPTGRLLCRLTDPHLLDGNLYSKPGVAHLDLVQTLAFSPDGYTLASGDYRAVKLWQRPRDVERLRLSGGEAGFQSVAIRPDGQQIATAGADHSIRLWNAQGEAGPVLEGHSERITGLCYAADGQKLYSASEDASLRSWDPTAGTALGKIDTPAPLTALALASDGTTLVTGATDSVVATWRALTPPNQLAALASAPTALATSADFSRAALAFADGTAQLVEFPSGKLLRELPKNTSPIGGVALTGDGKWIATAAADGLVKVFDTNSEQAPLVGSGPAGITDLAWHPGSQLLATSSSDGKVTVWSLEGAVPGSVPLKVVAQFSVSPAAVNAITFDAAGDTVYTAGEDGLLTAIHRVDGNQKFRIETGAPATDIAISPDGARVATAGRDEAVRLYSTADGSAQSTLSGFNKEIHRLLFTPDGRFLVAAGASRAVLVFDVATGRLAQRLMHAQENVVALAAATTSGDTVVTIADDGTLHAWPLLAGKQFVGHLAAVTCVESVPGTAQIVSGSQDGTLRQWDLATGVEVRKLELGAPVLALATRGDGQRLAAALGDNSVRLFETGEAKQLAEIKGDFKTKLLIDALASRQAVARQNADAAQQALDAAEKEKTDKLAAIPVAEDNLQKLAAAVGEAETKSKAAAEAQAKAEQLAMETAQRAKAAMDAKAASEKLAADLSEIVALATDALTKAQAAADTEAAALAATTALAASTKRAAEKLAAEPKLAELASTAEKVIADRAAMDQSLKAVLASLTTLTTEKQTAAAAANEQKSADEQAFAEAEAASKAAAEAKTAADKEAQQAAEAMSKAQAERQSAEKQVAEAQRVAKLAEELLPLRQAARQEAADRVAQFDQRLAAANEEALKHEQPIRSLAFSADNRLLAAAGDDGIVRAYLADTGAPYETFAGHSGAIGAVRFAPQGTLLSASSDNTARLWDPAPVWTFVGQIGPTSDKLAELSASPFVDRVLALAFSPDGQLLATGGGEPSRSGELKIWNVSDRRLALDLPEAHSDTIFGLEFSPDGKYLASCGADKFVRVFEVATGQQVRSFEGHTHHVLDVAWRADGKVLASCGADSALKLWDFETGEQQRTITGFGKEVTSVAFVGTGGDVVTSAGDKTLRLHNSADGRNQRNFTGGTDFMYTAQPTADGQWIVGGGADSVLRVWSAADAKQAQAFEPPAAEPPPAPQN